MSRATDTGLQAERALHAYLELLRKDESAGAEALAASLSGNVRSEFARLLDDYRTLRARLGESTQRARPGQVLGDFELVAELGRGGMGVVWEARQRSLSRSVALKLLSPAYSLTPEALSRFQREAEAGARFAHPGIVGVHAVGVEGGMHFIAQELVPGGLTLADSIDEWRGLRELPRGHCRRVAELLAQVAEALQAAHDAGVVHRDVKPSNILLTEEGRPKVADFGLAKLEDGLSLSTTGEMLGTACYMSPEQALGRRAEVGTASDIFSLGAALYECLTLSRAFDGESSQEVMDKILHADPPRARERRSLIPRDLDVLCGKALEKRPSDRYPTMGALARDLRHFLADEPIEARPPSVLQRGAKWCRRHPALATLAGVGGTSLIVIAILGIAVIDSTGRTSHRNDEVFRMHAQEDLDTLLTEAASAWPAHPDRISRYEAWIARAASLAQDVPRLVEQRDLIGMVIDAGLDERLLGTFPRRRDQLEQLITSIQRLTDFGGDLRGDAVTPEWGWSIDRRLRAARELQAGFGPGGEYAAAWERSLPAIHAAYPGLQLPVQMGLVPLGPDPDSGMWEFWHVLSGSEPPRAGDGRLMVDADSGIVLVLLPGGTAWIGSQGEYPDGPNYDPDTRGPESPPHRVELAPYFLSKYEMTQEQWMRATASNPSREKVGSPKVEAPAHPVEFVDWRSARQVVQRLGLTLPTEAQWEVACRAGSDRPFPFATDDFPGHANLRDESWAEAFGGESAIDGDDGYALHAPVGALEANRWGLHDMIGNVWEWCADAHDEDFYARSPVSEPYLEPHPDSTVVYRGGSFVTGPWQARASWRGFGTQTTELDSDVGLRPARPVER